MTGSIQKTEGESRPGHIPQQGQKGEIHTPKVLPKEEGVTFTDEQVVIEKNRPSFDQKVPPIDNSQAPIPTQKAIKITESKKKVSIETVLSDEEKKALQANSGLSGGSSVNPWMANPNKMAAFYLAMYCYMSNLSKSRFNEAEMRRNMGSLIFDLGLENADLAKSLRDAEGNKELIGACTQLANAVSSFYQIGATVQERGAIAKEYDSGGVHGEYGDLVKTAKNELDAAKKNFEDALKVSATETSKMEGVIAKNKQNLATEQSNLDKAQIKLNEATQRKSQAIQEAERQASTRHEILSRGVSSLIESTAGFLKADITFKQANIEKEKAMNEAMIQYFTKLDETMNRSLDNAINNIAQILEKIAQISSETKVSLSSRG